MREVREGFIQDCAWGLIHQNISETTISELANQMITSNSPPLSDLLAGISREAAKQREHMQYLDMHDVSPGDQSLKLAIRIIHFIRGHILHRFFFTFRFILSL